MVRPQWWKNTIWLDVLFYGHFYIFALYAFIKGRNWIRIPAIFYGGMIFADVFIILGEEIGRPHASPPSSGRTGTQLTLAVGPHTVDDTSPQG